MGALLEMTWATALWLLPDLILLFFLFSFTVLFLCTCFSRCALFLYSFFHVPLLFSLGPFSSFLILFLRFCRLSLCFL